MTEKHKPHIVLVVARGEAVRNFIFSDTLRVLSENARVTLISLVDHGELIAEVEPYVERIKSLKKYRENHFTVFFRDILHSAHYRWVWSGAVKYYWGRHNARVRGSLRKRLKLYAERFLGFFWANRQMLRFGTWIDRQLSWQLRPTHDFETLFSEIKPDLVFNCSHIHGPQADLPLRVAHGMGIPTAGFVFSWDNLTSRSRIFVPYDYYLMWNEGMRRQLLEMYRPDLEDRQVIVTGTPQIDFHFKPEFWLPREELCKKVGLDPKRPFILYTTGYANDFWEEHRIVEDVIRYLDESDYNPKPQLLVRTYIKGTSDEMKALAKKHADNPDVVFPPILWDKQWIMPLHEDLYVYTNLLRHTALGINAASTVTLELMALDKPVINLGFEPPGSNIPHWARFSRHVEYEHYLPVVQSGGPMVARSIEQLREMIHIGLTQPESGREARARFTKQFFGTTVDGCSGQRVAEQLIDIVKISKK